MSVGGAPCSYDRFAGFGGFVHGLSDGAIRKKADIFQVLKSENGRSDELCYADRFAAYIKLDAMTTAPLRVEPDLKRLRQLAAQYHADLDIEAVPDIQAWCHQHGVVEENPFRSAKVLQNRETKRFLVLLADPLTPDMISNAVDAMHIRGYISMEERRLLSDQSTFLSHLVLHEIAHALDPQRTEEACDRWALEQIGVGVVV